MIKININNEIDIYKTTLDFNTNFNKKLFIDKLKIVDTLVEASKPTKKTPGRQSALSEMYMPELNFIKDNISNLLSTEFNVSNNFIMKTWVYYSDSDNGYSGYHTHETLHPTPISAVDKVKTNYTFTYYLQMPNNLKNDEGKLFFRTKSGFEFGILPNEDDVFIFSADLEHRPEINPNSTKSRIVIAGNTAFFDEHLRKTEKSFL